MAEEHVSNFTRTKLRERVGQNVNVGTILGLPHANANLTKYSKSMETGCIPATGDVSVMLELPANSTVSYNSLPFDVFTDPRDVVANPGVYTWILYKDTTFSAVRTLTTHEIHSKHFDLYGRMRKPVVIAGELYVDADKNVTYNFLSGTFMLRLAKQQGDTEYSDVLQPKYKKIMEDMLIKSGGAKSAIYSDETVLRKAIATKETLQRYKDLGYHVHKFASIDDCKKYEYVKGKKDSVAFLRMYENMKKYISAGQTYEEWLIRQRFGKEHVMPIVSNYFAEGGRRKTRRSRHRRSKTRKSRR